ncbi:MAG: hypothetical protein ACRYFA_09325 [Janthinobacterium lividum]
MTNAYETFIENKDKRKRFTHIGGSIVILVHSHEKYEDGHNSFKLFVLAGIFFLTTALFHSIIEKNAPWIDGVFFLIEGILSIIVTFDFFI